MPRKSPNTDTAVAALSTAMNLSRTSADWDAAIRMIEAKEAAARERLAELGSDVELIELNLALGHDGAEAEAVRHRERARLLVTEIEGLARARQRAEQERGKAAEAEQADVTDRLTAEAQVHARHAITIAGNIDKCFAQLGRHVAELSEHYLGLLRHKQVHDVEPHRLHSAHVLRGAIYAAGGAELARFLDLPLMSSEHRRPLVERERRKWENLMQKPTKAGARRARVDSADADKVAKIEAELLERYPDLWVDADTDTPEAINSKSERLRGLICAQLDALEA